MAQLADDVECEIQVRRAGGSRKGGESGKEMEGAGSREREGRDEKGGRRECRQARGEGLSG
eukprot:1853441-Rhodomonas_salina.2